MRGHGVKRRACNGCGLKVSARNLVSVRYPLRPTVLAHLCIEMRPHWGDPDDKASGSIHLPNIYEYSNLQKSL